MLTEEDEIIIVDNASTDNTKIQVNIIQNSFPDKKLIYIQNQTNLGFGTANNIGAKRASGKNLIFTNNDVVVVGNFVKVIETYLENHPKTAVGPSVIVHPTGWNDIWKEISLIPYIEGWCMGLEAKMFWLVNGYDENIFIDYDDIDISYRLHLASVGLARVEMPVFHPYYGNSFDNHPEERKKQTNISVDIFGKKWGFTRK